MDEGARALGASLKARREAAGLTRREVYLYFGVAMDSLASVESGRRLANLSTLYALSKAYDTTVTGLLSGVPPWDAPPAVGASPEHEENQP